ncbi:MAG TPA: trypsin-like peptidase domain-containing protein, partial [Acidimicrobiales bacterium]|nr:trypsin-like peptidase domain-containing protein [Acidimicrobiales bacterium]
MPGDDPFDEDQGAFPDPPDPDDRLWRHPSEMARVGPAGSRSVPDTIDFLPPPRSRPRWGLVVTSSLVGASAALLAVMLTGFGERVVERQIVERATVVPVASTLPPPTTPPPSIADIVERVVPTIARIEATGPDGTVQGSALVVRADGHLLTDALVLAGAEVVTVRLADGRVLPGEVVAVDALTDLAVIRVAARDLPAADLTHTGELRIGQVAVAVGTHDGGGPALSSGVISAIGVRAVTADGSMLHGMIQTDAAIPSTAAGGPLVTGEGQIVGIAARAGADALFGVATPIAYAAAVADEMIEHGVARHPWLGIEGRDGAEGPELVAVAPDSPAAAAGLAPDDIVLTLDGERVTTMA